MYQTFYLYLSGSWKFGDYSIQLAYNLNCYWFPQPTATICFYIFPFPKNELLSHPFETQGRPGRLTVSQLCPTLCDPVNLSMPGLPVHHQLPESTQTHVHSVGDAIPTVSSSVVPFSSCPQSFPASGSFQMNQLFAPGGQSIGVSASTSVLPVNTQDWFPLGWTGWISLQSKSFSRVFSNTTV